MRCVQATQRGAASSPPNLAGGGAPQGALARPTGNAGRLRTAPAASGGGGRAASPAAALHLALFTEARRPS